MDIFGSLVRGEFPTQESLKVAFRYIVRDQQMAVQHMESMNARQILLSETEIFMMESAERGRFATLAALAGAYKGLTGRTLDLIEAEQPSSPPE